MYSEKLEGLIEAIIADGEIEESEMAVLKRAAEREGEDPDELEIVVKGRLAKMKKAQAQQMPPMPAEPVNLANAKHGNVMSCPNCGAEVIGGKACCPECGYNFTNIKANSSAEKLAKQLQELVEKEDARSSNAHGLISGLGEFYGSGLSAMAKQATGKKDPKATLVENFPVPNTREDLLEFLTSIQPKAKKPSFFTKNNATLALEHAYWSLYSNCINKARISYKDDPDFQYFFEDFKKR